MTNPIQWDGTAEGATPIIDMILRRGGTARYHDASGGPGETTRIAVDSAGGASWRLLPGQWIWPEPDEGALLPGHKHGSPLHRDSNLVMAQNGWVGHTGRVYALDDPPRDSRELGGYSPLYIAIGTWEHLGDGKYGIKD